MSDVEDLIKIKDEAISVPFMRFNLLIGAMGENAIYYFVEGYDAPYYNLRIKNLCALTPVPVVCSGKRNVLNLFPVLEKKTFSKYKKLFFVDRDFDNNSQITPEVYVTPCYSIENFYVTFDCIENILMCEFSITQAEEEFSKIIELFEAELQTFHDAVLEFNAWYACIKKANYKKVCLDDNFPKDFINLSINNIQKRYDIEKVMHAYHIEINLSEAELTSSIDEFRSKPFCYLRGKYEMQFLCTFLSFLIDDANNPTKHKYLKRKTKFQINRALVLSHLSQYASTPECLVQYIKKMVA